MFTESANTLSAHLLTVSHKFIHYVVACGKSYDMFTKSANTSNGNCKRMGRTSNGMFTGSANTLSSHLLTVCNKFIHYVVVYGKSHDLFNISTLSWKVCHAIDSVKHNVCSCQLHAIQFLNSDFVTGVSWNLCTISFLFWEAGIYFLKFGSSLNYLNHSPHWVVGIFGQEGMVGRLELFNSLSILRVIGEMLSWFRMIKGIPYCLLF